MVKLLLKEFSLVAVVALVAPGVLAGSGEGGVHSDDAHTSAAYEEDAQSESEEEAEVEEAEEEASPESGNKSDMYGWPRGPVPESKDPKGFLEIQPEKK